MIGFIIGLFVGGFMEMLIFALCSVAKEQEFKEKSKRGQFCDSCVYYNTDRTDQPCFSCVNMCNFENIKE